MTQEADIGRDGPEPALQALLQALCAGTADLSHPRLPELLSWLRRNQRRSELRALLRGAAPSLFGQSAARTCELAEALLELGFVQLAYRLSAQPQLARDPELATWRARCGMQLGDYTAALAAADVAIGALLQPGLSVDEFLRLCGAGAPDEGLLRFERRVLAERGDLTERLALRWEALHRCRRTRDARLMQLMCLRYFPQRASVWATAGNHALDDDALDDAAKFFRRCLQLDPDWTAGLAGMAIVCERGKRWDEALPYRQRVVSVERALERDDAASLQRRLRYAAALARLARWSEAEPLFRGALRAGAFARLPAERPVLLRVFSQELYAPAVVTALLGAQASPDATSDPGVRLALHEGQLLVRIADAVRRQAQGYAAHWLLGLCAVLSGDLDSAFAHLDEAELDRPYDLAAQQLLLGCASATGDPAYASIRDFARKAARAALPTLTAHAPDCAQHAEQLMYAATLLPERAQELLAVAAPGAAYLAWLTQPADAALWLACVAHPLDLAAELRRLLAFRVARRQAGASPLWAAAASTEVLSAIAATCL